MASNYCDGNEVRLVWDEEDIRKQLRTRKFPYKGTGPQAEAVMNELSKIIRNHDYWNTLLDKAIGNVGAIKLTELDGFDTL